MGANAEVMDEEESRRVLYSKVDKGLTLSFIGGVLLGICPFFYVKEYMWICLGIWTLSLIVFFLSRYVGLKFLFKEEE